MMNSKQLIDAASIGILNDEEGKVLIASVPSSKMAFKKGAWEFPGGKAKTAETAEETLCRELKEEIGIKVSRCEKIDTFFYKTSEVRCLITIFFVEEYTGTPKGIEGQTLKWTSLTNIAIDYPTLMESHKAVADRILDRLIA